MNKVLNALSVMPNPVVSSTAMVKMNSAERGSAELRIISFNGKIVFQERHDVYKGMNAIIVNLPQLQPGVYTLQAVNEDDIMSSKFSLIR